MNLFKRLASLFTGGGAPRTDKRYLTIYVLSRRCNEPISGQVDLLNELSRTEEGEYAYYTRKVLHTSGDRRCFSQVEVHLYFNQDKQVAHYEVDGGRWLTSEEYTEELARFNAPRPEEGGSQDGDGAQEETTPITSAEANPGSSAAATDANAASSTATAPMPETPTPKKEESDHA